MYLLCVCVIVAKAQLRLRVKLRTKQRIFYHRKWKTLVNIATKRWFLYSYMATAKDKVKLTQEIVFIIKIIIIIFLHLRFAFDSLENKWDKNNDDDYNHWWRVRDYNITITIAINSIRIPFNFVWCAVFTLFIWLFRIILLMFGH